MSNLTYSQHCSIVLIDLAGSEIVSSANRKVFKEGTSINKSLLALKKVISDLSQEKKFVNFRDSKLTRILKQVLSGNSKSNIICTINPLREHLAESMNTIKFGIQAGSIKIELKPNQARINAGQDTQEKRLMEMTQQIARLQKIKT